MKKNPDARPSCDKAAVTSAQGKLWCNHNGCYKYAEVCDKCLRRKKCSDYLDYLSPRLNF